VHLGRIFLDLGQHPFRRGIPRDPHKFKISLGKKIVYLVQRFYAADAVAAENRPEVEEHDFFPEMLLEDKLISIQGLGTKERCPVPRYHGDSVRRCHGHGLNEQTQGNSEQNNSKGANLHYHSP